MNIKLLSATAAVLLACSCGNAKQQPAGNAGGTPEGVTILDVGQDTKLITIRDDDGAKRMPNKLFYGENDSAEVERLSPEGSVESSISCYVVETQGKKILFDTGNGAARGGRLLDRMEAAGITPGDIDILMITLSGGNAKAAIETMGAYGGRLHRFDYQDKLPCGIKAMPAPGHTPGHTVYQTGKVLIVGDLMHGFDLQIQDLGICPGFDMDRKQAVESRKKYVDYARKNKLIVAGMHFPGNGVKNSL